MRVVLVPGFSQAAASWRAVADELPHDLEPRSLDVPTDLGFIETAHALGDLGGRGTYVGYSMGGRLCLRLALDRPDMVERLVLVSASPGIADPDERAARRRDDERLAVEVVRDGAQPFLERWLAQPLFASLPRERAALDARIRTPAVLAHQLRALGQGAMEPLWDRLPDLAMPVTVVAGALDHKYVDLAIAMSEGIPDASLQVFGGLGHAVHLEDPFTLVHVLTS